MHFHLLGAGLTLWLCWHLSTAAGILLGATIPDYLQLGFAIPLTFIVVVTPLLRQLPMLVASLVSGTTALILQGMPWNLWLIIAAFTGMIAAAITDSFTSREGRSL
jgi:predicted branched-subunit amino acid permease